MDKRNNVYIGEDTCEEFYSNEAGLSTSNMDFILTFFRARPQKTSDKLLLKYLCRVFMSPRHAKAIVKTLGKAVEDYEQKYGTISDVSQEKVSVEKLNLENH